jgi:small neutral amino acid transporter SnatA (MarC family)
LRAGNLLAKKIGIAGMRVIERMMGLILMVIAVQFIINGLETIAKRF